jgi:hypothetical protein
MPCDDAPTWCPAVQKEADRVGPTSPVGLPSAHPLALRALSQAPCGSGAGQAHVAPTRSRACPPQRQGRRRTVAWGDAGGAPGQSPPPRPRRDRAAGRGGPVSRGSPHITKTDDEPNSSRKPVIFSVIMSRKGSCSQALHIGVVKAPLRNAISSLCFVPDVRAAGRSLRLKNWHFEGF